jgi:hypothetical protein
MPQCRCASKKHGHGDRCGRSTDGNNDFCTECSTQMEADRLSQAEPNLTPTKSVPDEH